MKKLILTLVLLFTFSACSTTKFIPVEGETREIINYIDSLVIRDSVRVIPIERIVEIVKPLDTLRMETSIAKAEAYYDTTFHALRGNMENKAEVIYRDRWRDRIVEVRDTVSIKEPVPFEVIKEKRVIPKWAWLSLIANILIGAFIGFRVYRKFCRF